AITRLINDLLRSSGYQNTTTSPRSIGSNRYTNLLMKMRSWSESSGAMLVPSTFTGWYKKTMMTRASPIAMSRSRVQMRISLRRLLAGEELADAGEAGAFDETGTGDTGEAGFSGCVEAPRCF